jgi:YbbR domain-containing protein
VRGKLEILQAEETKTLGVRVVTRGTPAAGYWIRSVTSDPPVVTVRGPRAAMSNRTFIEIVPVDVQGAQSSFERVADLALPESVTLQGGEPRVNVKLEVAPLEGTKEVNAAVQVGDVPGNLRVTSLSPGSVRVAVRGSGELFDRLRDEDVRVVISASGRSSGTFTVRPGTDAVRSPDGIRVVSVEEVDVSVTVEGGSS